MGVSGLPLGTYAWPAPPQANDTDVWSADPPSPNGMDDSVLVHKAVMHVVVVFLTLTVLLALCWAMFWVFVPWVKRCYQTLAAVTVWFIASAVFWFLFSLLHEITQVLTEIEAKHGSSTGIWFSWPASVQTALDDVANCVLYVMSVVQINAESYYHEFLLPMRENQARTCPDETAFERNNAICWVHLTVMKAYLCFDWVAGCFQEEAVCLFIRTYLLDWSWTLGHLSVKHKDEVAKVVHTYIVDSWKKAVENLELVPWLYLLVKIPKAAWKSVFGIVTTRFHRYAIINTGFCFGGVWMFPKVLNWFCKLITGYSMLKRHVHQQRQRKFVRGGNPTLQPLPVDENVLEAAVKTCLDGVIEKVTQEINQPTPSRMAIRWRKAAREVKRFSKWDFVYTEMIIPWFQRKLEATHRMCKIFADPDALDCAKPPAPAENDDEFKWASPPDNLNPAEKRKWLLKQVQNQVKGGIKRCGGENPNLSLQAIGLQLFYDGCKNADGTLNTELYQSHLHVLLTLQ